MRGLGSYNVAILADWPGWGVSAHFIDAEFRAFWHPPHDGVTLELDGQTVTLRDRGLRRVEFGHVEFSFVFGSTL